MQCPLVPPAVAKPSSSWTGNLRILLVAIVLCSLFRYLHDLLKVLLDSPFIDFAHYYTFGTAFRLNLDPFDPVAVHRLDDYLQLRRAGSGANYPPLFYLIMQPWVVLPFRSSAVLWLATNQLFLLTTLLLCSRRLPPRDLIQATVTLFVVFNYQPLFEDIFLGQSNILLLCLATFTWWGLHAAHPWIAAAAAGLMMHIKVQFGLLLPLLWLMGYGHVAARAILVAGIGFGVGLITFGPTRYMNYLHYILALPDYLFTWPKNISLCAAIHRLLGGGTVTATSVKFLMLTLNAGLFMTVARAIRRRVRSNHTCLDLCWGLSMATVLLLSPLLEEHHLVVLLLPLVTLILTDPFPALPLMDRLLFLAVILLLGNRYSLEGFPAFQRGASSLLTTGKLLGVICLAWLLLRRLYALPCFGQEVLETGSLGDSNCFETRGSNGG